MINFSNGTFGYIDAVADCGGDVLAVDWRMPLGTYWGKIGYRRPIMGNLDPIVLLGPLEQLRRKADQVLEQAAGRPGYIFNLGHGILLSTPVENVRRLAEYVHQKTGR